MIKYNDWDTNNSKEYYKDINTNGGKYDKTYDENLNETLEQIRIVGPLRNYTQVELLDKDNEFFEMNAPVRKSGDLKGSETIDIIGPNGIYHAVESTIVSDTHIHMSADDLKEFNRYNDETVSVICNNKKIDDVHIKSDETCVLEMHINKDIAEVLGIETGMEVNIC